MAIPKGLPPSTSLCRPVTGLPFVLMKTSSKVCFFAWSCRKKNQTKRRIVPLCLQMNNNDIHLVQFILEQMVSCWYLTNDAITCIPKDMHTDCQVYPEVLKTVQVKKQKQFSYCDCAVFKKIFEVNATWAWFHVMYHYFDRAHTCLYEWYVNEECFMGKEGLSLLMLCVNSWVQL